MLLAGMKVVSFCHFLQGPAAMQYLGDMGADIVKIEPLGGAYERHWAGAGRAKTGGVSAFYLCANRNARSIAIDLKHPEAWEIVRRLVAQSHVVAENFRPGTLDRLGLGYEALRADKSDLIFASASGFGATGPYAGRPGQDLLVQAMSGLVAATGGAARRPTAVGCAAVDQHGGALFALGIVGAYAKWLRTGEGSHVEASLLGAGIDLQTESLVTYFASGRGEAALERGENLATWFHEAPYGVYRIADGFIAISLNPLEKLARSLGSEAIAAFAGTDAYAERDAVSATVAEAVRGRTFAELSEAFDAEQMWYARVDGFDDLVENPQVRHNGTFRDVAVNGETVRLVNHPNRYDGRVLPEHATFALEEGAHTRELLEEAGYDNAQIEALVRERVVRAAQ